ncbi:hypothetical protein [Sorangium sp. So ce1151]|uniref:hypothetical protein n=1 Tax=Sorangium sp. So ce1151 TaxID=3133332 RepID=UPI003F5D8F99
MRSFSHGATLVPPPDRADPVIDALSMWSRAVYRERLDDTQHAMTRIMVLDLYSLTLIERSSTETADIAPPLYTLLKGLGHSCLGAYSAVIPRIHGTRETRATRESAPSGHSKPLGSLAEQLRLGRERFAQLDLAPEQRALAEEIFALHEELLLHATSAPSLDARRLEAWGRELGPRMERVFRWAARAQVDAIHAAVTRWAASRGEDPWRDLWVIPLGPRVAREGYLQTQYFERLLGAEGARERLVFGENIADIPEALRLLTAVVMDRALSATLFGDRLRLEMDILAHGAHERLDEIFGPSAHAWSPRRKDSA